MQWITGSNALNEAFEATLPVPEVVPVMIKVLPVRVGILSLKEGKYFDESSGLLYAMISSKFISYRVLLMI